MPFHLFGQAPTPADWKCCRTLAADQAICQSLKELYTAVWKSTPLNATTVEKASIEADNKASHLATVRLCNSSIAQPVCQELKAWSTLLKQTFLADIATTTPNVDHISTRLNTSLQAGPIPTTQILQSYKFIYEAGLSDGGYRQDFIILKNVAGIRNHPTAIYTLLNFLGGDDGLKTILQQNRFAPCNTCDNISNKHPYLANMGDYIAHIGFFIQKYKEVPGASDVVLQLKMLPSKDNQDTDNDPPTIYTVEGAAFMLKKLFNSNLSIQAFEKEYTFVTPSYTYKRFADIVLTTGTYIDCKSWSKQTLEEIYKKTSTGLFNKSFNQLKDYFRLPEVTSIDKIEYWFDKEKIGDVNAIKIAFQKAFLLTYTNNNNVIFEAIWSNEGSRPDQETLRKSLFFNADKIKANKEYLEMVNSMNSKLFNFIKN